MTTKALYIGLAATSAVFLYLWFTRKPESVRGQAGAVAGIRG
ncbi:MAG TPA: hypothetical protein VK149_12585 [Sideroxyarcus sp.]|nr:hypothetical protein [Sideroxyarcus sp.]